MKRIFFLFSIATLTLSTVAQQANIQFFIDRALSNSPLLKDYQNKILSNKIDSMRLKAGFGPQLNGVSNNYYAPVVNGWGFDEVVTDKANITAQISFSKEIVSRVNRENQYAGVQIMTNSLSNESKVSEQDLIKNVTGQYVNTYGAWEQYNYNKETLDLLRKEEILLRKLTGKDVYRQTDYLTFMVTLQQEELQLVQTESNYLNELSILYSLCGITDTSSITLSEPDIKLENLPYFRNSVFYQSFINDSIKLSIDDRQIDFSYKPKISIFSDAGFLSSWYYQPWKNFGLSAGINLTIPIYDGHQRKMQHDKISLAEQTRQNYSAFYLRQYYQQINQLFTRLKSNNQQKELLNKQIIYSQTLINANHKLLESGDVLVTDYVIAINNYLALKNSIVQNEIEKYQLINQINYWSRTK